MNQMDRPVRRAAAYFSQPVRQILMMLIITGLVGAGFWLVRDRLLPIIHENPWLNGLILGVFAFGILTCFWQVGQLVRSVRWVEGYASGRPGTGSADPPRLLIPLAHLMRSRGSKGGHISSTSARSILDSVSARIDEARDITRYLVNLLIFLGLLGTLYGLSVTVPAVVDTIRALAPKEGETSAEVFTKLMAGLESQLGGMGMAFSSSLIGLAGSLVVGLLELFASHGQNRFYGELEEWLSSFTRLSFAGAEGDGDGARAVIAALAQHLEEQADFFAAIREDTDDAHARLSGGLEQLTGAMGQVAGRMEGAAAAGNTALAQLLETNRQLLEALRERADGGPDAESRMRLRSIDTQMLRLLEEVAAGRQEALGELRSDLAQLTRAVRMLAGRPDQPGPGV
jgi:hypothetical protein